MNIDVLNVFIPNHLNLGNSHFEIIKVRWKVLNFTIKIV